MSRRTFVGTRWPVIYNKYLCFVSQRTTKFKSKSVGKLCYSWKFLMLVIYPCAHLHYASPVSCICLPSSRVVRLWKESLSKVNQKAADALADPTEYSNLFPGLQQALLAEQYLKETPVRVRPAAEYPLITVRTILENFTKSRTDFILNYAQN